MHGLSLGQLICFLIPETDPSVQKWKKEDLSTFQLTNFPAISFLLPKFVSVSELPPSQICPFSLLQIFSTFLSRPSSSAPSPIRCSCQGWILTREGRLKKKNEIVYLQLCFENENVACYFYESCVYMRIRTARSRIYQIQFHVHVVNLVTCHLNHGSHIF